MTRLGDALIWTACHAPTTFALLALVVGGAALLAHLLGRRIA